VKVSVVTPSLNQGRFIERTLQSVAAQLAPGVAIEHVVYDGGSSDETVEILGRFGPPLRWVSRRDKGQSDAVNQGIRATDGDIVGWLNADDVYYPGAIACAAAAFAANPDVDVVYGMADHIDAEGRALEPYPTESWSLERLRETCFICQPALFFRRRVVEAHGLLDESLDFCMDYELWLRLGAAGARFSYLPEKLAGSRLHRGGKTLGSRVQVHAEIKAMFMKSQGRVPDRWVVNHAYAVLDDWLISRQRSSTTSTLGAGLTVVRAVPHRVRMAVARIGSVLRRR